MNNAKMIFVVIGLLLVSCTKETLSEVPILNEEFSNTVTNSDINRYAGAKFGKTKGCTIDISPICFNGDTLAYILNYGSGWELLSADERYIPILAKGGGSYNIEELNPGQKIWLQSELECIKAIKDNTIIVPEKEKLKNKRFWKRLEGPASATKAEGDPIHGWELIDILEICAERTTTGHLIKTQWGQDDPWNQCVPYATGTSLRCVAGCVAVAGAQLLKFLHDTLGKPATFYTTGSCTGYETNPLFIFDNATTTSWDNMALTPYESTDKLYQAALLIGWVGREVGMDYSLNLSGAFSGDFANLMSSLSIDCSYTNLNAVNVWSQLKNKWPVYIRAETDNGDGHAWIIDGYESVTIEYRYIYEYTQHGSPYNEYGEIKYESEYETNDYILMNWGWNDYVDNNVYALTGAYGWSGGGYIFRNNKKVIMLYE